MRRKFMLVVVILVLVGSAYSQNMHKDIAETPKIEVSANLLGLFLGTYTAKVELPITPDGLFSIGCIGTYFNQDFFGLDMQGYKVFMDARIYPSHYTQGVYLGVEGGFSSFTFQDDDDSYSVSSIPIMALVGHKWAINNISLDLGFACGKQIYIGDFDSDTSDALNSFPFNISTDFFFLVGYRF